MDKAVRAGAWFRLGWPRLLEYVLIILLVIVMTRLVWTAAAPVGPLGDWRGKTAVLPSPEARARLFRSFDAFYPEPIADAQAQNVTSLALTLFGIRVNEASGQGSAIIAGPDGEQGSYAVGDEIQPGVTLKAVLFDHVVISRGGAEENIFIDQSQPIAPIAAPQQGNGSPTSSAGSAALAPPSASDGPTVDQLKSDIGFAPRMANGRITGIVVAPRGPTFEASGLREGDIITQVNGKPVGSASDLAQLQQQIVPGARLSLMVERGAKAVPIAIMVPNK